MSRGRQRSVTGGSFDIDQFIDSLESEAVSSTTSTGSRSRKRKDTERIPGEWLRTNAGSGLGTEEITRRRKRVGLNQESQKSSHAISRFAVFTLPILLMTGAAILLAAGLRSWVDFGIICGMLCIYSVIVYFHQSQAHSIIRDLAKAVSQKVTAIRNGNQLAVDPVELVPGDVVHVQQGTIIPADCRAVDIRQPLVVQQNYLAGTFVEAQISQHDMVSGSSVVVSGEAVLVVTATGDDAFPFRARPSPAKPPFAQVVDRIGTALCAAAIFCLTSIWTASFYRSRDILAILEMTLSFLVVSVPFGLQAVVMFTFAVGVAQLAREDAVVHRLSAVEFLATTDYICLDLRDKSDKKGRLSERRSLPTATRQLRSLGLKIKLFTLDSIQDIRATCQACGLNTTVFDAERLGLGADLASSSLGSELYDFVEAADALVNAGSYHKWNVVDILQQRENMVAISGTKLEDIPSLKKADCGISMVGAPDATLAAADVVLLSPDLSATVHAIQNARQVFQRMYGYIVYRASLCLYMDLFFGLWLIIFSRPIRLELAVLIALFVELPTLAVAYDRVPVPDIPTEWLLSHVSAMSFLLASVLAGSSWIALTTMLPYHVTPIDGDRGGLAIHGGIAQNFGHQDAVIFLQVTLSASWVIFVTRVDGMVWKSRPSWVLFLAVLAADVLASVSCIFGWFVSSQTSIVAVVRVWIYCIGVFAFVTAVYYMGDQTGIFEFLLLRDRRVKSGGNMFREGGKSNRREMLRDKKREKKRRNIQSLWDFVDPLGRVSTQHEKSQ